MQITRNILFFLGTVFLLSQSVNGQFNQEIDSIYNGVLADIDTSDFLRNTLSLHHSNHINDVTVFDSQKDYLNNIDATRIMQSKSPGLQINANSYTPGASSSIVLRGYRSILGSNEPLIILDGMPIDNIEWGNGLGGVDQSNRLIDINPNDIESIELIKSAVGRAKYGIVGGNGVILITSKKGNQSKPVISIRTSFTINKLSSMPELQNTFSQGRQFDGIRTHRGPDFTEAFSWGPAISDLEYDGNSTFLFDKNGRLVNKGTGNGQQANTYDPLEFFQSGLSSNINASITGGSKLLQYYASVGYNNQQGVIPTNKFNRYNVFGNVEYSPLDKLTISGSVSINSNSANRSQKGSNVKGVMLGLLRTSPTFDNTNMASDPVNDPTAYEFDNGNQRSFRSGIYDNPYWTINKNPHEDNVTRSILNLKVNYNLLENLDLTLELGNDQYLDERIGGIDINPGRDVGSAYENTTEYNSQNSEVALHHVGAPLANLQLNTTVGINYNTIKRSFNLQQATSLKSANNVSISNGTDLSSSFIEMDRKRFGTVLALDATYNEYLHLDANVRQDYSNRFGEDTNGYLSYGFGLSFELDNFIFSTEDSEVPHIVLHASRGKFGSDINAGNTMTTFSPTTTIGGDGFLGASVVNSPELNNSGVNPKLTAETTIVNDIGVDFKAYDGKYQFGILLYKEESSGLLINRSTALTTGISNIIENSGALENNGFEVSLGVNVVNTKKYKWNFSLAFNKNINKVITINDVENSIQLSGFTNTHTVAMAGEEYGTIIGSGFLLNDFGQLVVNNEGFPVSANNVKVGNPNPDWTMYVNNSIAINDKINISASIDIKSGGDIWCGTCGTLDYFGRTQRAASEVGQSIFFQGVTLDGQVNAVEAQLAPSNGNSSTFYRVRYGFGGLSEMSIYDASWIRLRTVSVDYDISGIFKSNRIKDFTIGIFANNLFVMSDYPSVDPETNLFGNSGTRGFDYYNNPGTRQIGVVVNLTF